MRKYIVFFNKFIFFTKKCYFFHYSIWIVIFTILSVLAFTILFTIIYPDNPKSDFFDYLSGVFLIILFISFISLVIIIPITIFSMLIKYYVSKSVFVSSNFLLNNKKYHFVYCIALSILIICWLLAIFSGLAIIIIEYGLSCLSFM